MINERCETCRWWAPAMSRHPEIASKNSGYACKNPALAVLWHDIVDDKADCAGVDGDDGVFVTGPRFGCAKWEAKEQGGGDTA